MTDRPNSRELILDILLEILERNSYSHAVLHQALGKYQYLEKPERALITRTVEGTLEYLISIDAVLNRYSKTPVKKMKPLIRTLLRMSVYQILYLDRIPDSAVCNEAVKLAVKRKFGGLKGFVNGVLRTVSREKETIIREWLSPGAIQDLTLPEDAADIRLSAPTRASVALSLPEWLLSLWTDELGWEQTKRMGMAFLKEAPTSVRCNLHLASVEEITDSLRKQGVSWKHSPYSPKVLLLSGYDYLEKLTAFSRGWIQVQDVSSVLAGEAARPKKGDYVIDVCAAPGGKSLHMADMLCGTGFVEARDVSVQKVELIEENICRTGFANVRARVQDALIFDANSVEKADVLVADLPCSGLGIIGKKPDIKYNMSPEAMDELVKLQREILSVVWQYVKPGGILVYSTCTIHRAENQGNMEWMTSRLPFERVDIAERFPEEVREASMREGWMQFLPGKHACDGFFVGVLRRESVGRTG